MDKTRLERENFLGLYFWLAFITVCLTLYFIFPDEFSPASIRRYFSDNLYTGLLIYFLLFCLRAFTLIPHTPLLFTGILVFPAWPLFIINLAGINASVAIIYYLSRALRFDRYFDTPLPDGTRVLAADLVLEDPLWLEEPFTTTKRWQALDGYHVMRYECNEPVWLDEMEALYNYAGLEMVQE